MQNFDQDPFMKSMKEFVEQKHGVSRFYEQNLIESNASFKEKQILIERHI